jgi:uncharacterized protein (DUF2141 family)
LYLVWAIFDAYNGRFQWYKVWVKMTIIGSVRNFNAIPTIVICAVLAISFWSQESHGNALLGEIQVPLVQVRHLGQGELVVVLFEKLDRIEIEMDKAFRVKKLPAATKGLVVVFGNVPYGEYAVGVFHDLNKNGRLDTNFFGFPKEDMAVSNNAKGGPLGGPPWSQAKFQLAQSVMVLSTLKVYPFGPKATE